jgi:uncharacterized protein (TIGR00297 family)
LVLSIAYAGLGVAITVALAGSAVFTEALTFWAGVTASVFGSVIVVVAGFPFLALLVLFVVASVLATRYALEEKTRRRVQEGTRGERGVDNVLAHIVIPMALALATLFNGLVSTANLSILYAAAIAFGSSDTFASEFGVLQGGAVSILTFRPVEAGVNGGVSKLGTLWAAVGALVTAVAGLAVFQLFGAGIGLGSVARWIVVVAVAGFLGCQVDSVLGETLENRGYLTKGGTNFLGMASTVGIAYLFLLLFGGLG